MNETSRERRATDYRELMSMRGPVLDVKPISGTPPYVDAYELTINVRSIVGPEPTYRGVHKVILTLPAGYPLEDFPKAVMVSKPYPFHTNWFKNGAWCYGSGSHCTEGLGNFVVRLIQTLQFDEHLIDTNSAANLDASNWYKQHKNIPGLFPCDTTKLPQPVVGGMMIKRINKY